MIGMQVRLDAVANSLRRRKKIESLNISLDPQYIGAYASEVMRNQQKDG
jgi:hypothetical protein